jgi:hypothetical protein
MSRRFGSFGDTIKSPQIVVVHMSHPAGTSMYYCISLVGSACIALQEGFDKICFSVGKMIGITIIGITISNATRPCRIPIGKAMVNFFAEPKIHKQVPVIIVVPVVSILNFIHIIPRQVGKNKYGVR